MSTSERDTHFMGFADLLYPELTRLFYLLYTHRHANEHHAADQVAYQIKEHLARRAYDLVEHAFREMQHEINDYYDPLDALRDTPDLTELPPTE